MSDSKEIKELKVKYDRTYKEYLEMVGELNKEREAKVAAMSESYHLKRVVVALLGLARIPS